MALVELKGEEVQFTTLDSADQDKLVLVVFDSVQHCVVSENLHYEYSSMISESNAFFLLRNQVIL